LDEYDIEALKGIIDEIDRDIIVDINPKFSLLKELVKLVDDIDFDRITEQEEKYDDFRERLLDISFHIDDLSEGIDILESLQTNLEKFIKAMDILNIEHNIDIDEFNEALEKISKAYNKIENDSGI
jgi:predicted  nucleic acid-binding Zn-ribbon protein